MIFAVNNQRQRKQNTYNTSDQDKLRPQPLSKYIYLIVTNIHPLQIMESSVPHHFYFYFNFTFKIVFQKNSFWNFNTLGKGYFGKE